MEGTGFFCFQTPDFKRFITLLLVRETHELRRSGVVNGKRKVKNEEF